MNSRFDVVRRGYNLIKKTFAIKYKFALIFLVG